MYVMLTTPAIWAQFLSLLILMRFCAPDMAGVRWPAILFGIGWLCSGFFLALLLTRPLLTAPLWPSGPLPRSAVLAALSVGLSALALHGRPVGPFVAGLIAAVAAYGLTDHFELVLLADIALGALLALPARYRPSAMPAFWRNAIFVISALGLLTFAIGLTGLRTALPWAVMAGLAITLFRRFLISSTGHKPLA